MKEEDMPDTPHTPRDVVRTLIRAVDDADRNAIAALTANHVNFRFGNAAPTDTQSELLAAAQSFRDAIADLRHTILDLWRSVTVWSSPLWMSTTGALTAAN